VHRVDPIGWIVWTWGVNAEDLRFAVAKPIGAALIKPRVLACILGFTTEAIYCARAEQQYIPLAQVSTSSRALQVAGANILARLHMRDIYAGAFSAKLTELHAVDRRSARARIQVAKRINVCWSVIAEGNAQALIRKVAVKILGGVFKPMMLPHLCLKMAGVYRHALINLLR
jgi:hypothetical protein